MVLAKPKLGVEALDGSLARVEEAAQALRAVDVTALEDLRHAVKGMIQALGIFRVCKNEAEAAVAELIHVRNDSAEIHRDTIKKAESHVDNAKYCASLLLDHARENWTLDPVYDKVIEFVAELLPAAKRGLDAAAEALRDLFGEEEEVEEKPVNKSGKPMPLIDGVRFEASQFEPFKYVLGEDNMMSLRSICSDKPVFGVVSIAFTRYMVQKYGPSWCGDFVIERLSESPRAVKKIIQGEIPPDGRPLSDVVPDPYPKFWKNKEVEVYKAEDFDDQVDDELIRCCRGRPVFTPDAQDEPITREWAKETARVLASDEVVRRQILDGKLRFLGQPLCEVVAGARVKQLLFKEEDLGKYDAFGRRDKLREHLVGKPVFFPDEGCEFVLAQRMHADPGRLRWPAVVATMIMYEPLLGDMIISGELPVDGRRLGDIRLPTLPVLHQEPSMPLHVFNKRESWKTAYEESRLLRVADFPASKPEWAVWVSDEEYVGFLRRIAGNPPIAGFSMEGVSDFSGKALQDGFYNEKHCMIYECLCNLGLNED